MEVESSGDVFTAEGAEIVLSAGAVASPQMLMLSGVGPGDHLRGLGIHVIHDLAGVGQNMRDHPRVSVQMRVKEGVGLDPYAPKAQVGLRYTASGSKTRNDMLISPSSFFSNVALGGDPMQPVGVSIGALLYLAAGAGELTLTSADPHVQPHMDYRYLEDPWDRERLREGVRLCLRLLEHTAFSDIVAERIAPTDQDLASDEALDAWMLKNASTCYHVSGTC